MQFMPFASGWSISAFFLIYLKDLLIYLEYSSELPKLSPPKLNSSWLKLQATIDRNGI